MSKINFQSARFFLFIFLSFSIISENSSKLSAEEWTGWRGLHLQARSESPDAPVQWSETQNVQWSTKIEGRGYSSPVVSENQVFVTSAWETEETLLIQRVLFGILLILIILLCLALIPILITSSKSGNTFLSQRFLSNTIFWMVLGLLIYSIFASYRLPPGSSSANSGLRFALWFHSGSIVALCVVLALFHFKRKSQTMLFIAVASILWGIFLIFARPFPEYYYLTNTSFVVLEQMYLPVAMVLGTGLVLFIRFFKRPSALEKSTGSNLQKKFSVIKFCLLLFSFVLGLSGFISILWFNLGKILATILMVGGYCFPQNITSIPERIKFLFDSSFSFPWLLAITNLGFFLCLIAELKEGTDSDFRLPKWFPVTVIFIGLLNFITTNYYPPEKQLVRGIICLDRATGEIKWKWSGFPGKAKGFSNANSPASPTPVIDSERVYAYFGAVGLVCTDHAGHLLWKNTDLPFEGIHGVGASPIIHQHRLILLNAMSKAPYLTALDCRTGQRLWTTHLQPWDNFHDEHRSPLLTACNGKNVIIDWGGENRPEIRVLDVETGIKIAEYPTPWRYGAEYTTTVLAENGILFLSDQAEFHAVDLTKLVQGEDPLIWVTDMQDRGPNTATPVYNNGMLFMVSDLGWASCLDSETGQLLWQKRLGSQRYQSSPVAAGNLIYFSNIVGGTTIVAADRIFNIRASNELPTGIYASPAVVDGEIFMRTTEKLFCLRDAGKAISSDVGGPIK